MSALEAFLHNESAGYPVLIVAAMAHVQFETIHPFLDGNGRIGRLLIPLLLHHAGILQEPLLYLSLYFKQHRDEYYRLLDQVRTTGDREAWLDFFLEGVEVTASGAVETAQRLAALVKDDEARVQSAGGRSVATLLRIDTTLPHEFFREADLTPASTTATGGAPANDVTREAGRASARGVRASVVRRHDLQVLVPFPSVAILVLAVRPGAGRGLRAAVLRVPGQPGGSRLPRVDGAA
jgi:Fic family protein